MGESKPPVPAGEERVATESAHLAAIVRSSDDAILSKDRDAVITSWNAGARRLYGYTAQEVVGKSVAVIIPPERQGEEFEIVRRILAGERIEHYETERVRKDGTRIAVSLRASPIHDDHGEIVGVSTQARGLSSMSRALIDAEQRLRGAFRAAPIGMCTFAIVDGDVGPIEQANNEMSRLLGYSEDELQQMTPGDLTHPEDAPRERLLFEQLAAGTRTSFGIEKRNRHKDGHWVWIWVTVALLEEGDGPRTALAHMLDIGERKRTEEELMQTRENLERSNAELDQFAYVASHDLKEPLILVSAYARMVRDRYGDRLEEEGRKFIGHVIDEAARMKTMIDDLLDYSRLETRAESPARVDLGATIDTVLRTLGPQIDETGARVEVQPPLPVVQGSASQLERVLRNLLANAIKFRADEPPTVVVSAEQEDGEWVVCVRDNGIGVEPGKEERIFEVFQRLHGDDQYAGSGMGLAICKRIVERHQGRIWVEPAPSRGSVFKFALPT